MIQLLAGVLGAMVDPFVVICGVAPYALSNRQGGGLAIAVGAGFALGVVLALVLGAAGTLRLLTMPLASAAWYGLAWAAHETWKAIPR